MEVVGCAVLSELSDVFLLFLTFVVWVTLDDFEVEGCASSSEFSDVFLVVLFFLG